MKCTIRGVNKKAVGVYFGEPTMNQQWETVQILEKYFSGSPSEHVEG